MLQENPRLVGAISFANSVLGIPTREDLTSLRRAGKSFLEYWDSVRLSAEQFTDPFRERLFLDTVHSILRGLHPQDRLATRMRFGLDGTPPMNPNDIAESLEVHPTRINYHLGRTMRESGSLNISSRAKLREFQKDQTNEELAERLDTLPPIDPYRKVERVSVR